MATLSLASQSAHGGENGPVHRPRAYPRATIRPSWTAPANLRELTSLAAALRTIPSSNLSRPRSHELEYLILSPTETRPLQPDVVTPRPISWTSSTHDPAELAPPSAAMVDHIPIKNRSGTIIGTAIAIQTVAVLSVIFRVYVRQSVVHGLGWDDLFVCLACTSTLIGTCFVVLEPASGLGKHITDITMEQFSSYLHWTFATMCTYATSTSFIKISILLQYIRVARRDYVIFRRTCIFMIVLVSSWGLFYFLLVVLSCIPTDAFWDINKPGKCIMFGSPNARVRVATYISQAASNMVLDLIIFLLPLWFIGSLELSAKGKIGLAGLFTIGACVVGASILRLSSMSEHQLGLIEPDFDPTWYEPMSVISGCLEVNIAVLCASIPVFWPVLKQLGQGRIFVVREVMIQNEPRRHADTFDDRSDDDEELQLTWDRSTMQYSNPLRPMKVEVTCPKVKDSRV